MQKGERALQMVKQCQAQDGVISLRRVEHFGAADASFYFIAQVQNVGGEFQTLYHLSACVHSDNARSAPGKFECKETLGASDIKDAPATQIGRNNVSERLPSFIWKIDRPPFGCAIHFAGFNTRRKFDIVKPGADTADAVLKRLVLDSSGGGGTYRTL